jgi:hypothetical protein
MVSEIISASDASIEIGASAPRPACPRTRHVIGLAAGTEFSLDLGLTIELFGRVENPEKFSAYSLTGSRGGLPAHRARERANPNRVILQI